MARLLLLAAVLSAFLVGCGPSDSDGSDAAGNGAGKARSAAGYNPETGSRTDPQAGR